MCCPDNPNAKKEAKLGHSHHGCSGEGTPRGREQHEMFSRVCLTLYVASTVLPEETEVQGL